jgi:RHS repeat-associated protein
MSRTVRNSSVVQSVRNIAYNLLPNAAPQAVQSDAMESTQIQALYEPPLAAKPQLSEKPHQGFESKKTAGKPGSSVCNFTVTLGLRATVVENGVRKTYRARYYNPSTGRFLSRDPEDGHNWDPRSLHKYLYANGDPVDLKDPTGRGVLDLGYIEIRSPLESLALKAVGFAVDKCLLGIAATLAGILDMYVHGPNIFNEIAVAIPAGECLWKFFKLPPPIDPNRLNNVINGQ